jgi:hypothetical protein
MTKPNPLILLGLAKKKGKPVVETVVAVASVTIEAPAVTMVEGAVQRLNAVVRDAAQNVLAGRAVTWGSSNEAVATVSSAGYVTAVAAGTTTITASCDGMSDTADITVTAPAPAGDFVVFDDPWEERLLGPMLTMAASGDDWPYYVSNATTDGRAYVDDSYPRYWPRNPSAHIGTVSITAAGGLTKVYGTGTNFLTRVNALSHSDVDPQFAVFKTYDNAGVLRGPFTVASVESDEELTLSTAWSYGDITGKQWGTNHSYGATPLSTNVQDRTFYDLGLCIKVLSRQTGEAADLARFVKQSTCQHTWSVYEAANPSVAPRSAALCGLILRALHDDKVAGTRGSSEFWDTCARYVYYKFNTWQWINRLDPGISDGVRDPSYTFIWAAWLARVLPDSFPCTRTWALGTQGGSANGVAARNQFRTWAIRIAVDYWYRLMEPRVDYTTWTANGGAYRNVKSGGWHYPYGRDEGYPEMGRASLPFHDALCLEAFEQVHKLILSAPEYLTGDAQWVKDELDVRTAFLAKCRHNWDQFTPNELIPNGGGVKWRAFWYFGDCEYLWAHRSYPGSCTVTNGSADIAATGIDFTDWFHTPGQWLWVERAPVNCGTVFPSAHRKFAKTAYISVGSNVLRHNSASKDHVFVPGDVGKRLHLTEGHTVHDPATGFHEFTITGYSDLDIEFGSGTAGGFYLGALTSLNPVVEATGGTYSRKPINFAAATGSEANASDLNSKTSKAAAADIPFGAATADHGTIVGWGVFAAASGGAPVQTRALATPLSWNTGETLTALKATVSVTGAISVTLSAPYSGALTVNLVAHWDIESKDCLGTQFLTDLAPGDDVLVTTDGYRRALARVHEVVSDTHVVWKWGHYHESATAWPAGITQAWKVRKVTMQGEPTGATTLTATEAWPHNGAEAGSGKKMWGAQQGRNRPLTDWNDLEAGRQIAGDSLGAWGYAYKITGDPVWLDRGDEVWGATIDGAGGLLSDGHHAMTELDAKSYNQLHRNAWRYLAYKAGG